MFVTQMLAVLLCPLGNSTQKQNKPKKKYNQAKFKRAKTSVNTVEFTADFIEMEKRAMQS